MRPSLTAGLGEGFSQLGKRYGSNGSMGSKPLNPPYLLASRPATPEPGLVPSRVPWVPRLCAVVCWRLLAIKRAKIIPWRPFPARVH
jgi:hypothetical protein